MNWEHLDSEDKHEEIIKLSNERRVLIFMFSRNNSVNYLIKYIIEREWNPREMEMPAYILDPDSHKNIASELAKNYGVKVYSPQALIIEKGKCIFSAINGEIDFKTLRDWANPKNLIKDGIKTAHT